MQIQVLDTRPPLSAVIALAKAEQCPHLAQWREDMSAMSAEVARKYFGALTEEVVRDGVEACVNLLSMGLLRSTSGGVDPEAWLQSMRTAGVRGVSRQAVEMIKGCDALPTHAMVFAGPDPFHRSLLMTVLSYASKAGPARAYRYLAQETADRVAAKRQVDLAEWLFANTPSGRVARRTVDEFFGTDSPEAEEVIHRIMSLACGVAQTDPFAPAAEAEGDEETESLARGPYDLQVFTLGPRLLAEARRRYDELLARIPVGLRPALVHNKQSWFERYVLPAAKAEKPEPKEGEETAAPKPAKKPSRKKSSPE